MGLLKKEKVCIDHKLNGPVVLIRRTHEAVRQGGGRRCREVRHPGQERHSEPQKRPGTQEVMADWRGSSPSIWTARPGARVLVCRGAQSAIDFATWEKSGLFLEML